MLMTEKKIIVTKHCIARIKERKYDNCFPSVKKRIEENPIRYIISLFKISQIKSMTRKEDNIIIVITKDNYRMIVKETPKEWIVKTLTLTDKKKRDKRD